MRCIETHGPDSKSSIGQEKHQDLRQVHTSDSKKRFPAETFGETPNQTPEAERREEQISVIGKILLPGNQPKHKAHKAKAGKHHFHPGNGEPSFFSDKGHSAQRLKAIHSLCKGCCLFEKLPDGKPREKTEAGSVQRFTGGRFEGCSLPDFQQAKESKQQKHRQRSRDTDGGNSELQYHASSLKTHCC